MNSEHQDTLQEKEDTEGRGCFFWGCLTLLTVLLLTVLLFAFGLKYFLTNFVEPHTATSSTALPSIMLSSDRYSELKGQLINFETEVTAGKQTEPLTLSAEDVMTLIFTEIPDLNGMTYLTFEEDKAKIEFSVPLNGIWLSGRYLNGTGVFAITFRNGNPKISLVEATLRDEPMPDEFAKPLQARNWAQKMDEDPKMEKFLEKLENIEIVGGKIVLTPKS